MVPKLSQSQGIPRFWKSVVETKIFLLDPWRTGMSKPRAIRAHIIHFFTYPTRPSCGIHYYQMQKHYLDILKDNQNGKRI